MAVEPWLMWSLTKARGEPKVRKAEPARGRRRGSALLAASAVGAGARRGRDQFIDISVTAAFVPLSRPVFDENAQKPPQAFQNPRVLARFSQSQEISVGPALDVGV